MRILILSFTVLLSLLLGVSSATSATYKNCKYRNSADEICEYFGEGKYKGDRSIESRYGATTYRAYFFRHGEFAVSKWSNNDLVASISVAASGHVGRNLAAGEYFPDNKTYNNTLSDIRRSFVALSNWKRRSVQTKLKQLGLYRSSVDGLWGRNTYNGILGYNAVFRQSLSVPNRYSADTLLNAIHTHSRFDYRNGRIQSQTVGSSTAGCSISNVRGCSKLKICNEATIGTPPRWRTALISKNWVAEAKRRKLTCKVNSPSSSSQQTCFKNISICNEEKLCLFATKQSNGRKVWESSGKYLGHVREAKRRGLNCGVQTSTTGGQGTCFTTASLCDDRQICTYASMPDQGARKWVKNPKYQQHVREAKRRGLSCGVPSTNIGQTCFQNISVCNDYQLCSIASKNSGGQKSWETAGKYLVHVREAKRRGLTCGISNISPNVPNSETCSTNPNKCGAVELCQKAVQSNNNDRVWRTDVVGKRYADAAKSIGLNCNVTSEQVDKTYRVANGTGFYVSEQGFVVTNQHVIDGCNEVQIHSSGQMAPATIVSQDKINDLALLRTKLKSKSVFNLAPDNPYLLQDIVAAGFPFGESVSSTIKVTKGVVSSLSGLGDNSGQIQIDAALQPGNSGGPIIDENGNVVGVAVAKLDLEKSIESWGVVPENVNFGIKLSNLKTYLDDNAVEYKVGKERPIGGQALGKLATEATVLLSCWMTEAQIETMQNQKAMFSDIIK